MRLGKAALLGKWIVYPVCSSPHRCVLPSGRALLHPVSLLLGALWTPSWLTQPPLATLFTAMQDSFSVSCVSRRALACWMAVP